MKKLFLLATFAMGAFLFSACTTEQSEMSLDSIEGKATIQGKVMYDQGACQDGDAVLDGINMVPAGGVTVTAKVPYSAYKSGSEGDKLFTVTTDAAGNYSVTVPATSNAAQVTINVLPFYTSYGTINSDGTVTTTENTLFNNVSGTTTVNIEQGDVQIANIEVTPTTTSELPERNQTINIKGKVTYSGEVLAEDNSNTKYKQDKIACSAVPVRIKLYKTTGSEPTIIYNSTTDENGEYNLTAAFYENWNYSDVTISASVEASYTTTDSEKAFKHYVQEYSTSEWFVQNISGVYSAASQVANASSNNKFLVLQMPDINQTFTPEDYSIIRGIGNPDVDKDQDGIRIYALNDPMYWGYGRYY